MNFKDGFLKNNAIVFIGTSMTNIANLLCQLLIVRRLNIVNYGTFSSLLSIFMIISFPVSSLATMVAKFAPYYNSTGERQKANLFLFVLLKQMFFIGVCILGVYIIFGPAFKNYLHLESVLPVYITGGMLFLSVVSAVTLGGLQGFERFGWFSASIMIGSGLKLFLVFLFISRGWDLLGALGAFFIAGAAALVVGLYPFRDIIFAGGRAPLDLELSQKYKFIIPSVATLGCIAMLTSMDMVLVKHFFSAQEAGDYSVAQLIGKIVLFIPSAAHIVMFPGTSGLHAQKKDARGLLKKSLVFNASLCVSAAVLYNLFPDIFLRILTGKVNADIIFLGRLFSVAMTFFSFLIALLLYQLSISRFKFLKTLVLFTSLQVVAISVLHVSPTYVVCILLLNSILLFAINFKLAMEQ